MKLWKKTKLVEPAVIMPVDEVKALDEAKAQLLDLAASDSLRTRSLEFARSLLRAVGENPETLQNQLLIHQMAIENLRARQALVNAATRSQASTSPH
jgi:hypothetical protein